MHFLVVVERSFWELPLCSANRALLSFFMVKDVFVGGNFIFFASPLLMFIMNSVPFFLYLFAPAIGVLLAWVENKLQALGRRVVAVV